MTASLQQQIDAAVGEALLPQLATGAFRQYTGPNCEQLSAVLADQMQAEDVLLASSGTAALEIALRAAGIGEGDHVLLSGYDYPGNFWAIERVGALPVLLDIEPQGWRIDPEALAVGIKGLRTGRKPKALIASHLHGQLQDMAGLRATCEAEGILLVEDTCQALGATLPGSRAAGSLGHMSIVSFGGGKILSAGRGGALLTSDSGLAQRARRAAGVGSGAYELSELQAAMVNAQWPWLGRIVARSRQFFSQVVEVTPTRLNEADLAEPPFAEHLELTSFYQAGWILPHGSEGEQQRAELLGRLANANIKAGGGFSGFHRRSPRRALQALPLQHVAQIAERTFVVHHSVALLEHVSAQCLAEQLF